MELERERIAYEIPEDYHRVGPYPEGTVAYQTILRGWHPLSHILEDHSSSH